MVVYLSACSIPTDRSGSGGLGGCFPCWNVFTNAWGMMSFMHFSNVTTCWLSCTGFTQADKAEHVDSVYWKKSHKKSVRMKCLYVFMSVSPVMERIVWLCASLSHYTIPKSYTNALLIWISRLPLNVPLFAHMYSGILASTVSSFLPVVNNYLTCIHVDFFGTFSTLCIMNYGNNGATCSAMAASGAQHQGSFSGHSESLYLHPLEQL